MARQGIPDHLEVLHADRFAATFLLLHARSVGRAPADGDSIENNPERSGRGGTERRYTRRRGPPSLFSPSIATPDERFAPDRQIDSLALATTRVICRATIPYRAGASRSVRASSRFRPGRRLGGEERSEEALGSLRSTPEKQSRSSGRAHQVYLSRLSYTRDASPTVRQAWTVPLGARTRALARPRSIGAVRVRSRLASRPDDLVLPEGNASRDGLSYLVREIAAR